MSVAKIILFVLQLSASCKYLADAAATTTTVDVVIIGAGISGLGAARSLSTLKPKLKVLILEVQSECPKAHYR